MRISELSRRSGVTIASIKYYLREGLLPAGQAIATNQADYTDDHVRRLRLIRGLIEVGDLPIASVRRVLTAVDSSTTSLHNAFGAVMGAIGEPPPATMSPSVGDVLDEVRDWLARRGWAIDGAAPAPYALAQSIATLRAFDFPVSLDSFDAAADAIEATAEVEVAYARAMANRTAAVETMLVGTVMYERALAEVRRLALEAVSSRAEAEAVTKTAAKAAARPRRSQPKRGR